MLGKIKSQLFFVKKKKEFCLRWYETSCMSPGAPSLSSGLVSFSASSMLILLSGRSYPCGWSEMLSKHPSAYPVEQSECSHLAGKSPERHFKWTGLGPLPSSGPVFSPVIFAITQWGSCHFHFPGGEDWGQEWKTELPRAVHLESGRPGSWPRLSVPKLVLCPQEVPRQSINKFEDIISPQTYFKV